MTCTSFRCAVRSGGVILCSFLAVVLGLWGLYLAAANAFLSFGGYRWALAGPPDVDGDVEFAYSLWPGWVVGRNLHLIVHDPSIEAYLVVERFEVDIDLLGLPSKRFRTRFVDASGVRFRLRKTRPLPELCRLGPGYPDIPGQAKPADLSDKSCLDQEDTSRDPGPPPDPDTVFKVDLRGVRIFSLEEIWLENHRVQMNGSLEGSWFFSPAQRTTVRLDALRIEDARSQVGPDREFDGLKLAGRGSLRSLDLREPTAGSVWEALSLELTAGVRDASLPALRKGAIAFKPLAPPTLFGLEGRAGATATVALNAGRPDQLTAHLYGTRVGFAWRDYHLRGRIQADVELVSPRQGPRLVARTAMLRLLNVALRSKGRETKTYPDLQMRLSARAGSTFNPERERISAGIDFRANRAALLLELIPGDLPELGAKLMVDDDDTVDASVDLQVRRKHVRLSDLDIRAGNLHIEGGMRLEPHFRGKVVIHAGPLSIGHTLGEKDD